MSQVVELTAHLPGVHQRKAIADHVLWAITGPTQWNRLEMKVAEIAKGRRVTGTERDKLSADLKKKYSGGASIRELAASTGRSYGFVHRVLTESGATLRGRGGATRGKSKTKGKAKGKK